MFDKKFYQNFVPGRALLGQENSGRFTFAPFPSIQSPRQHTNPFFSNGFGFGRVEELQPDDVNTDWGFAAIIGVAVPAEEAVGAKQFIVDQPFDESPRQVVDVDAGRVARNIGLEGDEQKILEAVPIG